MVLDGDGPIACRERLDREQQEATGTAIADGLERVPWGSPERLSRAITAPPGRKAVSD